MVTLTPVEGDPFAAPRGSSFKLTPVDHDPFAVSSDPEYQSELTKIRARRAAPHVPGPAETEAKFTPEQEAADTIRQRREASAAQRTYENRTVGERALDTASFIGSLPVRTLTRGEYGAGDVAQAFGDQRGADALRRSESSFVQNNRGGLEALQAFGDVTAGIPMLSTMGAVPGQVLRTGAAAARQVPGEFNAMLRDTRGAAPVPGSGPLPPPGAPPIAPAAAPTVNPLLRSPTRTEAFEAADRLKTGIGETVDLPEMVVGNKYKQSLAAGLRSVPFAGEPVELMYEKGLGQLQSATRAAGRTLGEAKGAEATGGAIKQTGLDWIRKNSKDYLRDRYNEVASSVDEGVTRPLSETQRIADTIRREQSISTVTTGDPALAMVEEALKRPGGLNAKGLQDLRSAIGSRIDAAATVPDAAEAAYKRLYGALDKDLQETLKAAGGDKAVRAWQVANREARIVAGKRKRIAQVIGTTEDRLSDEAVFRRIQQIASENTANTRNLRQMREIVGERQWGDVGAEFANRLGVDPKTGQFSSDRYLTAYNKLSDEGKNLIFGAARPHLDDIALIAKKFGELSGRFNRSNTGTVNAVIKLLSNPVAGIGGSVIFANPAVAAGQLGGLAAGRRVAWSLARPASAARASKVLRAYYGVARAAGRGAEAVANNEQELASAVRSYAQAVARDTGASADDIERNINQGLEDITKNQGKTE